MDRSNMQQGGLYNAAQAFQQLQQHTGQQQQPMPQQGQGQQPPMPQEGMPQEGAPQEAMPQGGGEPPITEGVIPSEESNYAGEDVDAELFEKYGEVAEPDEQEEYDMIVERAMEYIWEEDKTQPLMELLKSKGQAEGLGPDEVIGGLAADLVQMVDDEVEGEIDDDLVIPIGNEIVEQLTEFASGSKALQVNEATPTKAAMYMQTQLMNAYGIDEEMMREDIQSMDPADLERTVQTAFKGAQ